MSAMAIYIAPNATAPQYDHGRMKCLARNAMENSSSKDCPDYGTKFFGIVPTTGELIKEYFIQVRELKEKTNGQVNVSQFTTCDFFELKS